MPKVTITPSENGPYIVSGPVRLTDVGGREIEHHDPMAMCRCGHSANKPFCDGTHATIDFDGMLARGTGDTMKHAEISTTEMADRLAIRELVDAYAHCADRRDAAGQKSLFTEDTRFVVYMEGQGSEPTQVIDGRDALTPVFDDLNRYQATMHFNGQSTIALDGDRGTGESYCIAHHLFTDDGERKLMVAWLRYGDTFLKVDDGWLFAERNLYVDWAETRPSNP